MKQDVKLQSIQTTEVSLVCLSSNMLCDEQKVIDQKSKSQKGSKVFKHVKQLNQIGDEEIDGLKQAIAMKDLEITKTNQQQVDQKTKLNQEYHKQFKKQLRMKAALGS